MSERIFIIATLRLLDNEIAHALRSLDAGTEYVTVPRARLEHWRGHIDAMLRRSTDAEAERG